VLTAYNDIIGILESRQPLRLESERADFRRASTDDALLIVRAELVAGAKLARAGVDFEFGKRGGVPLPDLILTGRDLAIEVKARRLDGFADLYEELNAALVQIDAPVIVHVLCDEQPLAMKPEARARVVNHTIERVQCGQRGTAEMSIPQPWASRPRLVIAVQIVELERPPTGRRVITSTCGTLTGHFQDLEKEVLVALSNEQKIRQAQSVPTILLVEASRTGLAWMRPQRTWATRLAEQLPAETPFRGIGLMISSLDSPDVSLSIGVHSNISPRDAFAIEALARDLGLAGPKEVRSSD
jgi:hypothetical protein